MCVYLQVCVYIDSILMHSSSLSFVPTIYELSFVIGTNISLNTGQLSAYWSSVCPEKLDPEAVSLLPSSKVYLEIAMMRMKKNNPTMSVR